MAAHTLILVVTSIGAASAFVLENIPVYPTPQPTCVKNGIAYNDGDSIPSGPCSTCTCRPGQVLCMYEDCARPDMGKECVDSVPFACGCRRCPNGPNCSFGNFTIPYGQEQRVDERTICRCETGGVPPKCRLTGCMYQGKFYSRGIFYPTPCLSCECGPHSEVVNCSLNICIVKPLECVDAIVEPGKCCHVCPNGPNCFVGNKKIPAGQDYNDGSQICRCPETNPNLQFGSVGPQAVCKLVGPMPPPSTTHP